MSISNVHYIRYPDVVATTGLSHPTVKRQVKLGLLPTPVALGCRAVGFPRHEVEAVNKARLAGASDEQITALVADLQRQRSAA